MTTLVVCAVLLAAYAPSGFAGNADSGRVTCELPRSGGSCVLDFGEVAAGRALDPLVRFENLGLHPVTVSVPDPRAMCIPSYLKLVLEPGGSALVELKQIDTSTFRGPLVKSCVCGVEPPGPIRVTLYASRKDLEADAQ